MEGESESESERTAMLNEFAREVERTTFDRVSRVT
jgi:hypothetical protein